MMFKSSLLVSVLLAAGIAACHHDQRQTTPAEPTTTGMTATAEPGNTTQNNSYNNDNSPGAMQPNTEDPNKAIPGGKEPLTNDPDKTGSPGTASGATAPNGNDTNTGVTPSAPDTTVPTTAKDAGSGSNTGTGSNATSRNRGKTSGSSTKARSGSNGSGSGSSDGSAGSGSDEPPK